MMEIRRCRYIGIIIIVVGLCVLVTGQRQNINRRRVQLQQQQSIRQNNLIRSRQNGGGQRLQGTGNFNTRNNNARIQQRNRLQQSINQNQGSINLLQQPSNIVRTRLQNNQRQNMRQLLRPVLQNSNRIQNSNSFTTLQPVRSTPKNVQQRTSGQNSFQVTTLQPIFSTQPNVQNYTTINDSNTIKLSEGDGRQQHGHNLQGIQQQQPLQSQKQYLQPQEHRLPGSLQQPLQHSNEHHMSGLQQQLQPQEYYLRESQQQQLRLTRQQHQLLLPQENNAHGYRQLQLVRQIEHHQQLQPQEHYPQGGQQQLQLQPQLQPRHQQKMEYSSLSQQRQVNQQQQQQQQQHTHQQKLPEQQHQQLPKLQRQGHGQRQQQQYYQISQQNGNIQQELIQEPKQASQHQQQSQIQQLDQRIQHPHHPQEKQQKQRHSRQQVSDLKPNLPKQQEGRSTQNDTVLDNGSYTLLQTPVKNTHSSFGHIDNTNQEIQGNGPLLGLSNSVPQGLLSEYLDRRGNTTASHRHRAVLESNQGPAMRNGVAVDSNLGPVEMPRNSGIDPGHRSPLILHPSSKQMLNIPNSEIGIKSQPNPLSNNLQRQEHVHDAGRYPIPPKVNAARGSVDSQMTPWSGSFSDIGHRRHDMQSHGNIVNYKGNPNTKYQNINNGGQVLQAQEPKDAPYKDNPKSGKNIYTNTQFYPDQTNNHGQLQYAKSATVNSHPSRVQKAHRGNMIPDQSPTQMEVNPIYVHGNDVVPGQNEPAPALDRSSTRWGLDRHTDMNSGTRHAGVYNHQDSTYPIIEHNIDSTSIDSGKTQNNGKPITANVNRRLTIAQPSMNVYAPKQAVVPSLAEVSTTQTDAYEGSNQNVSSLAYRHFGHVQEHHSQQHQRHIHQRQQPEQHHQHSHQAQGQQDQQQSIRQQIKELQPNPLMHQERTRAQTDIPLNNDPIIRSGVQMLSLENQNNFHSSTSNNGNKAISGREPLSTKSNNTVQGRYPEHLDRQSSMGASYQHHNLLETNQELSMQSLSHTSNVMGHGQHDPNNAPNPSSYTDNRTPENTQYTLHRPGQQGTGAFAPRQNEPPQISQSQASLNNTATNSNNYATQAIDQTQFVDQNGPSQLSSSKAYQAGSDPIMDTVRQEAAGQWHDSTGLSQSRDFGQQIHEPYSQHQPSPLNQHFDQPHQRKNYPDTTNIDSHGPRQGGHQSEYYRGNQFPAPNEYLPPNQYFPAHQYPPSPESNAHAALPSHLHLPSSNLYSPPSNEHSQLSDQYPLVSDQYPLVSDQYSPLSNQYAPPSNPYAPLPNPYAPSSNQHLSLSDHYFPPADQHSPLSSQYAPPSNQHATDSNQYPPSNQYSPPIDQSNQYAPPSNQNAPQSNQYQPPSNHHLPPSNEYAPPQDQYSPPYNQYPPAPNQHLPPPDQYLPPPNQYPPPPNQYPPPVTSTKILV